MINGCQHHIGSYCCKNGLVKSDYLKRGNVFGGASILMGHSNVFKESYFDENLYLGEDWDLLIRIVNKFKVWFFNMPLVIYNQGGHERITNESINMSIDQIEKRLSVVYKHKDFLGPYWFDYNVVSKLLSYIRHRENKVEHILYTVRRCGFSSVLRVFFNKIIRRVSIF